jgi:hypothetical protein
MKISKIKKPNNIQRFVDNQLDIIREIKSELKMVTLKIRSTELNLYQKDLLLIIKKIKSELADISLKLNVLKEIAKKYKIKWFDTYETKKSAGILQRTLIINYKHLLLVFKKNKNLDIALLKSLFRNYRKIYIGFKEIGNLNIHKEIIKKLRSKK